MAHLYIYSPSGAVRDVAGFRRAIKRLQQCGHTVEIDPDALSTHQRFAGDDATRIAAITRAAASGADVALLTRGGYGLTRILPQLPWKKISRAIEKGTQFVGLSDFTALQTALLAQTLPQPAITWAGNLLIDDWGQSSEPDEITEACFNDLLAGESEGAGWLVPKNELPALQAQLQKRPIKNAMLWGGNLCVLTSLLGTPYFPAIDKGVLFLEDVAEHPYRIERMLTQLLHAGVLDKQQAIVLGQFTEYEKSPHDKGFNLAAVVQWLRSQTRTPIITGLPHGHVPTKVLLPVGASVDLQLHGRDCLLLWGHVCSGHCQHH
ncbi:MAG: LD-carboxypeptidase [Brachymonas sp.]|nr:LD-carboxypeptidase [Brachymonas sp.]MDO4795249.1 LD-carboxypeptidase [Brachymonas sp.]